MIFRFRHSPRTDRNSSLVILLGACQPEQAVVDILAQNDRIVVREAFTSRGVLQNLSRTHLVILGDVLPQTDVSPDVFQRVLDKSAIPVVSQEEFRREPAEWLGRARLTGARQISFLPARHINLVNWSGGVGKTTLALAVCKRFASHTGLPVALLELSMGGSALHARISADLPEFFSIATRQAEPALWNGVSLYPMDGRTVEVLSLADIRDVLAEMTRKHTLVVVDGFPGHPLFAEISKNRPGLVNVVVTSPRDDALLQARRLLAEIPEPRHLVMNMARTVSDRTESGLSVVLPCNETWAQSIDPRLADPILELVYSGWKRRLP